MVNHIKQFRQKKKLTQKELAKELGITQTVVGKYEHGDISPRPDKWQKMADFFGVSVSWLNGDWISFSEFQQAWEQVRDDAHASDIWVVNWLDTQHYYIALISPLGELVQIQGSKCHFYSATFDAREIALITKLVNTPETERLRQL